MSDFCNFLCSRHFCLSGCMACVRTFCHLNYRYCWLGPLNNKSWWRHQMETLSALLAICAGNSPVPGEFTAQRPVTRSFYVFFDLRLNKRLSKQSWGWWFETLSCPLWRHCNVVCKVREVGTQVGYLLLMGSSSHDRNTPCKTCNVRACVVSSFWGTSPVYYDNLRRQLYEYLMLIAPLFHNGRLYHIAV